MPTPDEWFNEALHKYRAGTLPAYKTLDLGRMPFHSIDRWLSRVPVLLPQKMLGKAKEKHLLDLDGFQGLPSRVQKPAAIFESKDQPGRFIIVTDLISAEGPVVVVVAPAQNRDSGTHWVVVSVHARDATQLRCWEAAAHSERDYLVLCSHTHEACEAQILPNLRVWTGGARYRHPAIQRVIKL